ncbi:MAG: hypothetical protein K0Q99_975 [Clostridia bacterium]|jgi:uncharacterized membrane protein YkvA (DUF1232 family)|nr:hypothetical protein [Clostridia bacterium]
MYGGLNIIMLEKLKTKAKGIKQEVAALYLAYRHPDVPWYAKVFIAIIIGYAISPIDLIPDFIPVLGYLDDLILIPAGIALALKMIPKEVMRECRKQAAEMNRSTMGRGWIAAALILLLWAVLVLKIIHIAIKK